MLKPVIDWLSITIKHRKGAEISSISRLSLPRVLALLCMSELAPYFVPMKGIHRYQMRYSYQGITINEPYEDRLDGDGTQEKSGMGYNITMSGSGVRFFVDYHRRVDSSYTLRRWVELLSTFQEYDIRCSRIDVAMDDMVEKGSRKKPLLEFKNIESCIKDERVKTRAKKTDIVQKESFSLHKDSDTGFCKPEPAGKTVYFGSRKSEKFTRIYDKLAEQEQKNPQDDFPKQLSFWMRCETEYKGDTAMEILKMYLEDDWQEKYCAHLLDMLSFMDERGNVYSWWVDFCQNAEPHHLFVKRKHVDTGDFLRMRNNFFYQMGRNAFTIMLGLGVDEFYNQLLQEEKRLKKQHWSILHGYYHDQQLDKRGFVIPDFYIPKVEQLALEAAQG